MNSKITDYDTGIVTSLGGYKDTHIKVSYIQTNTNKELSVIFSACDIRINDEIEFIHNGNNKALVQRNISQNKTKNNNASIHLPHEVVNKVMHEYNDIWKLEKYHKKINDFEWLETVFEKYIYLVQSGSTKWGARDPYDIDFKNSTHYMQNIRNILFYFYIHRTKEVILEIYHDGENFSHALVNSIITEYYNSFLYDLRGIPINFQSFEEFEIQLATTKQQIGL